MFAKDKLRKVYLAFCTWSVIILVAQHFKTTKHYNRSSRRLQSIIRQEIDPSFEYGTRRNLDVDVRPGFILREKKELSNYKIFDDMTTIPLIIHQVGKNYTVSRLYKNWMKTWLTLHPKWKYWFWTERDISFFIKTRYPHFVKIFLTYSTDIQRHEAFRYLLLYEFGGLYVDLDIECLKPLGEVLEGHKCVLSSEPLMHQLVAADFIEKDHLFSNALMASRPRHPYLQHTINFMVQDNRFRIRNPSRSTGSLMLEDSFETFQKTDHSDEIPHFAPPDVFQPKFDPKEFISFVTVCDFVNIMIERNLTSKKVYEAKEACKPIMENMNKPAEVPNGPKDISLTIHHWVENPSRISGLVDVPASNTEPFHVFELGVYA